MTDRPDADDGTSSEDLIRQAREAFEPAAEVNPQMPADPASSEAVARPADYVRGDYYSQPAEATAAVPSGGPTYEAQRPSFFQRFGGLTIGIVVVLGFVVFSIFDKTTDVEDLGVGDCLLMPDAEEISSVESAECIENHELEVFGLVTLSEGDSAPYPGEDAVAEAIFEQCLPRFEPYVGTAYDQSAWYINAIFPTRESWEEADDRAGTCVLYQPGADDEAITLTGTARSSGE